LSAIGDVCNAVAVVQAIQTQWPETEITWVSGKLEAQLLEGIPNIRIIVFDKKQGWKSYRSLWSQLKGERFDALLHMQYAFRANIATLGIKAKYKLGFDSLRSQDGQTWFTNVKVPSPESPHVLDGLLAFATTLGIKDVSPKWQLYYSDTDRLWAQQYITSEKRHLVVVPAASKAYKNWTVQGYVDVIHYAQEQGWQVILAGSPATIEIDLAQQIEKQLAHPILNLVGKSRLKEMVALIDLSQLVIAPDTGPTHMANAVETPVIGLYAHHNPERTGPYRYRDFVVSCYTEALFAETGKKPQEVDWRTRVRDEHAMARINVQDVITMFDKAVKHFNL
jgi:heptosyltransferase I